jgi:hypothetical protein
LSNTEQYIKNRLDDQLEWYSKKSAFNKSRYRLCQVAIIIASALIPLINLTASAFDIWWQHAALIISALLGSIITIISAFMQLEKYFENWILYRTTLESLKREKVLFQNSAGEYTLLSESDKNRILVERIEAILSSEQAKFVTLQQQARAQAPPREAQEQPGTKPKEEQQKQEQPGTKPKEEQQKQEQHGPDVPSESNELGFPPPGTKPKEEQQKQEQHGTT